MEQLHPLHERESDVFSQSASTESRLPRPRTPPERISEEELHRWGALSVGTHLSEC